MPRQAVTNPRPYEATSADQSCRREMVCNLLTQIFVLAERTRAAKSAARRSLSSEATDVHDSFSLIELIQASYPVFERYGIGPPDDAVYHRYLLSLSINPERDWHKKISHFDLGAQPRVKRLCTAAGHRHGGSEAQTSGSKAVQVAATDGQRRHRSDSKSSHGRQASLVPGPSTPRRNPSNVAHRSQIRDRFGDMLSLDSPIQRIHDKSHRRHQLQMIATSIEQWRATEAVKQLVDQNKRQDVQSRKQQLLALCTHAVFHWVVLCLPEKIEFHVSESPRTLPLCILRRISVNLEVLKNSAQRIWVWQMKTLFTTWHQDARKVKTFRVRMIVKQRAAVLETAFQCIQQWRLFTETKKCSTDRTQWIAQRCSRSRLRTSLQLWRRVFQLRHVARRHSGRVLRKVLKSWQIAMEESRDRRQHHEMASKRRFFSRWKRGKERTQASRALLCVCSDQRRVRVLNSSFNLLRANVLRKQTARTRLSLWELAARQRQRAQTLRLWKMAIDQEKEFRERTERFHRYSRRRHLSLTFVAWASWTERQWTITTVLSDATEDRTSKKISLCFTGWKKHVEEASQAEEALVASVIQLRRQGVWEQWRKSTGTRSATRCLDSAYSFHLLAKVFTRWKQLTTRKTELHFAFLECQQVCKLNVLTLHWKVLVANMNFQQQKRLAAENFVVNKLRNLKRICLSAWQLHVRGKRTARLRGEKLECSVRRRCLTNLTWKTWRQAFWSRNVARLADGQLHSYRKSQTFRVWKQFVFGARQSRERALKVVEILGSFHLNACFRQWKKLIISKHRLANHSILVRQKVCRRLLSARWKTWRLALKTKQKQQERLSTVASKWQNRQLYASFRSWKTTWSIRKRHRHLLQTTLLSSNQKVLEIHFDAWKKGSRAAAAREFQILEAQDKLLSFKVKRTIRCWNSLRLKQHERKNLLVKSLALWRQTLLSSAFKRLLENKQRRKQKKSRNELARSRCREKSMQRIFTKWSTWSRSKDLKRRQSETARHRLDTLKMLRTVQKLRHNALLRRRKRAAHVCAVTMSSGHSKLASFSRWKKFIAQKHSNRRESAVRAVFMKNFRVRRNIQRWKNYVEVRKLLKHTLTRAVNVSTTSRLQLHFVNWKKFVTRQTFTSALKQKATAFRYFCLLPLYFGAWKTSLSTKKHKQELLLRARGLWSHQSESRAFKAWRLYAVNNRKTKCAVAKWKNQTMSRSFISWKGFELQQKKKQRDQPRAVNFYQRRMCHRILKMWRSTTRHDRLARSCAQIWYQNTSRRAFDTWTRHVKLRRSSRKFLAKICNQTLARVFTAWKENIELKTLQFQGIQERFALLWRMDTRQKTFARWKHYARLRSFLRKKLGEQREFLLQDVVKEWRRVSSSRLRSRRCALLVADRVKLKLLKATWVNWRTRARVLRCAKALQGKVTENRVLSDLRQRIRRWKQFAVLSIAVKEFACRQDLGLLRLVFVDGFQRFAQLKRKERDLTKQINCVHDTFLKEWLARKLQQRMSIIAASEDLRRSGSSKRLLTAAWIGWTNFHSMKQTQQAAVRQLRVQISRLEDRDNSLDSASLAGILRRWQTIQLARIFERWSDVTQAQLQARVHSLKAMEWWLKTQSGRYFQGWVKFCNRQRKQRQIRDMNVKNKLKRTWKLWNVFKAASLSKTTLNRGVHQFHVKFVYWSSFKMWRAASTSLRVRREQILELYHSSRLRLLAALLGEWRKFAAMEKTKFLQETVARVVYEEKLVKKILVEWKANVAGICYHRRQLQINTERLQVLLLCSSFRAWHSWTRQHKKLTTIMHVLSTKTDAKAASQIFTAWHLYAEKTTRLRHQAFSFLRFQRMQKGVVALRIVVQEQQNLRIIRQKAQLFRSVLSNNQVAIIFSRWRTFAVFSRKTRTVTLRYLQNKLLPAAWSAWVAFKQRKRSRKDKTLVAASCWKNVFLRKAWNAMVLVHKVEKQRHATMTSAELYFTSRRLRKTLAQWSQSIKKNQHFRAVCGKFLTRWRLQTAFRCFCALHDHVIYSKTLRVSEDIVRVKARATAMLQAWYAWRKLILILRAGKRCTQRRLLKRVWLCWVRYVAQTRAAKLRMRSALKHMHLQLHFKAFRALQTYTAQEKWKTHANVRVLAFRSQRLSSRYFFEWKAVVDEQISRREKLAQYLNVMQHSVQRRSFGSWYSFVTRRKALRSKVSQSLAMRTQLCSRMVFHTWKLTATKAQRNRMAQGFSAAKTSAHALKHWKQYVLLCKIERMIGTNELRQVESSFLSWRKAVAATHRIRAFRAKSARNHWLALVGMVFTVWKQRSQTHAQCRKLLGSVAVGNNLRFRFMLWQRFTAHRKRLVNLLLVAADPPTTGDKNYIGVDGESEKVECSSVGLTSLEEFQDELELVSLGQALAKKARVLQRFEVTWDLPQAWHRWRQLFHAQFFYRMRRLQLHFICWQRFAHQQRRNRWIVIKLTRQREAASAQTIFRAWAQLVARVKQLQRDRLREREVWVLVTTEMARREHRQLKTHWHAWKFHVEEARHLQSSLDAYYRARLLTKFWLVWCHDFRQIMSESRRETQRIDKQMRGFHLRRALRSLKEHQQRSKRARLVLEYFNNRHYDTLLPEVLGRWRQWCRRQKEVARCLEAARMNKTRRHFAAWKEWQNTHKWQRIVVSNLQSKSVAQQRREVWTRWRRYVKNRVGKNLALQKSAIFHVCSRLRKRWLRRTQHAIQHRELAETAHVRLCAFRGHRTVSRWRNYSRARRLRRLYQRFVLQKHVHLWRSVVKHAMATRFDAFLLRSKAKKMLVTWQQIATKHQYWRKLCGSFVGKREARTARRVFVRWQQLVNARQGKRLAEMHAEQSVQRRVWRSWNRATLASQLRRHEQLEQAAEHEALASLRQSLGVWQAAVKKQRERRFVLLSCVVKLQCVAGRRIQEVIFRAWRRLVERERRCATALFKRDGNAAKRALSFWSMWTRERQRRRQQLESAANYHSQRLKSAVFFYWQTYALAWQDAAKPMARRHHRQMSLPTRIVNADNCEDSDDTEEDVRRPISPVVKRLRQKKVNRTRSAEDVADSSDTVTLPDAVEISMDVKKRLLLLGKWKPQQNTKAKLLSSTT